MTHVPNRLLIIASQTNLQRWVKAFSVLMVVALGALHTWAAVTRYSMNADGISYLDIGDAYMRGDWGNAINAVWSPMYSWVLGLVMLVFKPTMRWEFPLVHLTNFVIYILAFFSFEYFWSMLYKYQQSAQEREDRDKYIALPGWVWFGLGYTLFIWSSLTLIEIWAVTPDMLMAVWVYLAAGIVLRIRLGDMSWYTFSFLGLVLGLGYLTKTIMLPIAFLFLSISLLTSIDLRRALPRVLLAFTIFMLIAGTYMALISNAKGRFTFGESGTLTYVRYANGVPYPHWQGEPVGGGIPVHPSRQIFEEPPIYEFATPITGTYPIGYDPSYWYEGVIPRYGVRELVQALLSNGIFYIDLFIRQLGVLLFGAGILYAMRGWHNTRLTNLVRRWGLAIVALATLGLYALVYVEGRYIAVFIVLLFGDLFANLRLPSGYLYRRLAFIVTALMTLFMLGSIFAFNLEGFRAYVSSSNKGRPITNQQSPSPSSPGEVAEELLLLGLAPGDSVGVIGYAFDSFWARLGHVQIVAEMFSWEADAFYFGDATFRNEAYDAFASTGARAIVAEHVPDYVSLDGWHQVGNTNYYIFLLEP